MASHQPCGKIIGGTSQSQMLLPEAGVVAVLLTRSPPLYLTILLRTGSDLFVCLKNTMYFGGHGQVSISALGLVQLGWICNPHVP